MKTFFITLSALCLPLSMAAQDNTTEDVNGIFNHLDLGVTMGSTGIGIDLASPIGNNVQVRTGVAFMPHFDYNMKFDVETYTTDENNVSQFSSNFSKISELMKSVTGYNIDQQIDMVGQPTYYNFKLLVDVFPFRNKKWHITGGFYIGPSTIAKAVNTSEDMPTLLGVGMYNKLYDYIMSEKYFDEPIFGNNYLDPAVGDQLKETMKGYGRLGVHIADYKMKEGETKEKPCMLIPDENGMMKAEIKVNSFKPYLGFGYGNAMIGKKNQFNFSFDCGLMFWGGTPQVITSNALDLETKELKTVDLAHDVVNVKGKVGDYVDIANKFKVFPVINLKIAYRIF